MIVIICGSRSIQDMAVVEAAIAASGFEITEVVCGMCDGPDLLGKAWADARGIKVTEFPANWYPEGRGGKLDRSAGYQRNTQMGLYVKEHGGGQGGCIACHQNNSDGTAHMIDFARRRCRLQVYVHVVR
jgi:hypothetical protein